MKKIISPLSLIFLLTLTACSSLPEPRDTEVVRFALRDDNIISWEEKGDGIAVKLNNAGQRKLVSITRDHKGSEMEIYAGRVLLTSEKISQTIRGESLYVEIDDDNVKDRVLAMLPAAKKSS